MVQACVLGLLADAAPGRPLGYRLDCLVNGRLRRPQRCDVLSLEHAPKQLLQRPTRDGVNQQIVRGILVLEEQVRFSFASRFELERRHRRVPRR